MLSSSQDRSQEEPIITISGMCHSPRLERVYTLFIGLPRSSLLLLEPSLLSSCAIDIPLLQQADVRPQPAVRGAELSLHILFQLVERHGEFGELVVLEKGMCFIKNLVNKPEGCTHTCDILVSL